MYCTKQYKKLTSPDTLDKTSAPLQMFFFPLTTCTQYQVLRHPVHSMLSVIDATCYGVSEAHPDTLLYSAG